MASVDESWRRKMLVQHIPEDWSADMLENFVEVVTRAELEEEEEGVERFIHVNTTVLCTFKQPVTDEQIQSAETRSKERQKSLVYSRFLAPPSSVLVMDVRPPVTSDNLLFYFESGHSGGGEKNVKSVHMYPHHSMAVVMFSSPEEAAAVVGLGHHEPSKGSVIRVQSCYEQFHKQILDDLKSQQDDPATQEPENIQERSPGNIQAGDPGNRRDPPQFPGPWADPDVKSPMGVKPPLAQKPLSVPRLRQAPNLASASSRRDSQEESNPIFYPDHQYMDSQNPPPTYQPAPYTRGGGRGGRNKRNRSRNRGRGGQGWGRGREDSSHQGNSGKAWGGGAEGSRGRGRARGGGDNYRGCRGGAGGANYRGKGRGSRGGGVSKSQEIEELFDFGSEHSPGGRAMGVSPSSPPQPILLDADCNPLGPRGWRNSSSSQADYEQMEQDGGGYNDEDDADFFEMAVEHLPERGEANQGQHDRQKPRPAAKPGLGSNTAYMHHHHQPQPSSQPSQGRSEELKQQAQNIKAILQETVSSAKHKNQEQASALQAERLKGEKEIQLQQQREREQEEIKRLKQERDERERAQEAERLKREIQERERVKEVEMRKREREERERAQEAERLKQERERAQEIERLRALEAEKLKREKEELEKKDQLRQQEVLKLQQQLEKMKQQETRHKETLNYPGYKLRLMKGFAHEYTHCHITVLDKEGTVQFYGTAQQCADAKEHFMIKLQGSEEESLDVNSTVAAILRSQKGQEYLLHLNSDEDRCAFDVQDSRVVCAAFNRADVHTSLSELKRNVQQEKIQVSKSTLPKLVLKKQQLENDFPLARMLLPPGGGDNVMTVDGINGDFELLMRELRDLCSQHKPSSGEFRVQGILQSRACQLWCGADLDSVKALIFKSGGEWQPIPGEPLAFTYEVSREVMTQVQGQLNNIHQVTKVSKVNLEEELKKYSERCLVICGLHDMGVEPFCRMLEGKMPDVLVRFTLPAKRALPKFEFTEGRRQAPRPARTPRPTPAPRQQPRVLGQRGHRHGSRAIRSYSTNVGSSTLTIKSGDITAEAVDGIVCVVAEDMDLKQTAVGQAILKKYPQCAQVIPAAGTTKAGRVVSKALPSQQQLGNPFMAFPGAFQGNPGTQGDPNTLHLVVLDKWPPQDMVTNIKLLVQVCLQNAVKNRNQTIAFPPLGMGRRFQFPLKNVVNAMVTTTHQFLQQNRGAIKGVTFVIYDVGQARQFREEAKTIINPPPPAYLGFTQRTADSASDDDDDDDGGGDNGPDFFFDDGSGGGGDFFSVGGGGDFFAGGADAGGDDDDDNDDEDELSFFHLNNDDEDENQRGRGFFEQATAVAERFFRPQSSTPPVSSGFEAELCLRRQGNLNQVKQRLLQELMDTFVHEDRLTDLRVFKKLGSRSMQEIKDMALRKSVVLSVLNMGGREVLLVRGGKVGVTEMMAIIKDKQYSHQQRQQRKEEHGGDIGHSMKLPSYWKMLQDGLFKGIEDYYRKNRDLGKLYTMSEPEVGEINALVHKTWAQHLVGHGKDARGMGHSRVKVIKVERLENPRLWEEYCSRRERLLRRAKHQQFDPVEKVKGSSGPLKTTTHIKRGAALSRELFHQVNEHYLFHGTKKDYIKAIHDEGLDNRIANDQAMLGRGVYAAESATKADQYTDDKLNRTSGNKTMILMRVLLGEPFINTNQNPQKFSRPPCKKCYKDRCSQGCSGSGHFDSVIDDARRNFREFVIYDSSMCYPEYFITYQRE